MKRKSEQAPALSESRNPDDANEADGRGFRAFGRIYKSERAAVVSLIDKICAGELMRPRLSARGPKSARQSTSALLFE